MRIAVDIDNNICKTAGTDYTNSIPIKHRIEKVNELFKTNYIIIYTGRNNGLRKLTEEQLNSWNVRYNELVMGKPPADIYLDSDSSNEELDIINKSWGREIIKVTEPYVIKILEINGKTSKHYHNKKDETFIVLKGNIKLNLTNKSVNLFEGDIFRLKPKTSHQLEGFAKVLEVSTPELDDVVRKYR